MKKLALILLAFVSMSSCNKEKKEDIEQDNEHSFQILSKITD